MLIEQLAALFNHNLFAHFLRHHASLAILALVTLAPYPFIRPFEHRADALCGGQPGDARKEGQTHRRAENQQQGGSRKPEIHFGEAASEFTQHAAGPHRQLCLERIEPQRLQRATRQLQQRKAAKNGKQGTAIQQGAFRGSGPQSFVSCGDQIDQQRHQPPSRHTKQVKQHIGSHGANTSARVRGGYPTRAMRPRRVGTLIAGKNQD